MNKKKSSFYVSENYKFKNRFKKEGQPQINRYFCYNKPLIKFINY